MCFYTAGILAIYLATTRGTVGQVLANCELQVFLRITINRFANINVHVYYSTVRGCPSQLLDSQFGQHDFTSTQSLNYTIKTCPTVHMYFSGQSLPTTALQPRDAA